MRKLSVPALLGIGVLGVACTSDPGVDAGGAGATAGKGGSAGSGGSVSNGGSAGSSSGAGGSTTAGSGGSVSNGGSAGTSGGSAGTSGGSAGTSGSGGSGGMSMVPSPGCGTVSTQAPDEWVEQTAITIDAVDRPWWVRIPNNYDETRAYPVVFLFHGCGDGENNVPMQNVTGEDAILVRSMSAAGDLCWDVSPDGPDVALFDAMLEAVLQSHCADTSRVFAAGYSSGSWLINTLECVRGDKLRAAGSVAGGTIQPGDCVGQVARVFVHDLNDPNNDISGSETERARLLEANHCDADTAPVPEDPAPCARYQGCDPGFPVIWCQTAGQGHDRQDDLAPTAFWNLFSEL